jgi:hypothetical protein
MTDNSHIRLSLCEGGEPPVNMAVVPDDGAGPAGQV